MPPPKNTSARSSTNPIRDAAHGRRLQRVLAEAGVASRRECEQLIEGGHVSVNGSIINTLPAWVDPQTDRVVVDGLVIDLNSARKIWVMLNKPARTLTTMHDEPGADRRTIADLVQHPAAPRLFPVGRLDYDTVGLILLTNDGEAANRLIHPRYGVAKTYRVIVKGSLEPEQVQTLQKGLYLTDRRKGRSTGASRTAPVEVRVVKKDRERTVLEITLHEGRNRQIRRMLADVKCPVKRLERIAIGPLRLKGLARGEWRELEKHELAALKKATPKSGKPKPTHEKPARDNRKPS